MENTQPAASSKVPHLTTHRVEALADGLFAIALTLLVLEIKVPKLVEGQSATELLHALLHDVPHFLSFFLSFIILGVYWFGHRAQINLVEKSNRAYEWLNILFFFFISVIPFSAALLGHYYDNRAAIIFYSLNVIACGAGFISMWYYSVTRKLIYAHIDAQTIRTVYIRVLFNPSCAFLAILVSFLSEQLSLVFLAAAPIYYILPHKVDQNIAKLRHEK